MKKFNTTEPWGYGIKTVIVMEYPYRKNTYAMQSNCFRYGDWLLIDNDEYMVVSKEVEAWGPGEGYGSGEVFFLYTLNKDVPRPMAATAHKLNESYNLESL